MVKIGETYYFMPHAYHHYIGTVVEILNVNSFVLCDVVKVISSTRGWDAFMAEGLGEEGVSNVAHFPDGHEVIGCFSVTPWPHPVPKRRGKDDATE